MIEFILYLFEIENGKIFRTNRWRPARKYSLTAAPGKWGRGMREPPEKWGRAFILTAAVLFLGWSGLAPAMGAASPSTPMVNIETARPADAYIAGYAMAIILREFNLKGVTLTVHLPEPAMESLVSFCEANQLDYHYGNVTG